MRNWNIKVEKFGKIDKADIEISPFTLFVGDNNSGKSYMMSLIYGIMQLKLFYSGYKINSNTDSYKKIIQWFNEINSENEIAETRLDENYFNLIVTILNETLMKNKENLIKSIFNAKINLDKIQVSFEYNKHLFFSKNKQLANNFEEEYVVQFYVKNDSGKVIEMLKIPQDIFMNYHVVIFAMIDEIIKVNFFENSQIDCCYLPTSRTGFLLTYKTLVDKSLNDKFNEGEIKKNLLTRPCSDFLSDLSSISIENVDFRYDKINKFIERKIIDGTIKVDETPTSEFRYVPSGSGSELPMFVSSGVITEMTPLLLMLKYKKNMRTLMMEEPEMCLHPKLQWLISRVLIQIVNTKTPVIVTTHSDNILQHINNMIKLNSKVDKEKLMKEYGYDNDDLISDNQIKMYQFDVCNNESTVRKLSCGEFGFEVPSFNDMLSSLLKESRAFEED